MAQSTLDAFQVIGDPSRRKMLMLLSEDSLTINSLADNFDMSRPAVSKHIKILTECELVKQEQKGREIYYHINANKIKEIDKWIGQFKKILETQFNQLDKVLLTIKKQKK